MHPFPSADARYEEARERYAQYGVDVDRAVDELAEIPISIHCWQGDDVRGFESGGAPLDGGIQATGAYPGRARTIGELQQDLDTVLALIPGRHRLNLHASYLDDGGKRVDRDAIAPEHFTVWTDWAKHKTLGLDFNPTFFSHPKASDGFTLSHPDAAVRRFWIEHGKRCREIGAHFAEVFGTPTVVNFWIPDGFKDLPADRTAPRRRLTESLDAVFEPKHDPARCLDAVESKLFGIGAESCTVGSHEFYYGYALSRKKMLCLDSGHFHPTESIADKISAVLLFFERLLLHVSRPVRWDSDHVVTLNDETLEIAREVVRSGRIRDVHVGLDFFDASINRIAAWVLGARNVQKALLLALLEPTALLREREAEGDCTGRLVLLEEMKTAPFAPVWRRFCERAGVPAGPEWLETVRLYEREVLSARD